MADSKTHRRKWENSLPLQNKCHPSQHRRMAASIMHSIDRISRQAHRLLHHRQTISKSTSLEFKEQLGTQALYHLIKWTFTSIKCLQEHLNSFSRLSILIALPQSTISAALHTSRHKQPRIQLVLSPHQASLQWTFTVSLRGSHSNRTGATMQTAS